MRFIHVADLHIGKVVNDFSMLEDQKFILTQIADMARANQADVVVIAGDIYDRSIPPAEAVTLFDSFLNELSKAAIQVIMISGNHDSAERICFGQELLGKQGVHIAGVSKDTLKKVIFSEPKCNTEFVLLPFCKPAQLDVRTSEEAVRRLLTDYWEERKLIAEETESKIPVRHVLVTHFFVTDGGKEPELSDSETTIHVGGLDNVDASAFHGFDYVALGHIHKPQQIGEHPMWYAGSPLKYSFGESGQTKSALLVTIDETGLREVKALPLWPLREMRKLKGSLREILEGVFECGQQDYLQAVLTDQGELIDPIGTIRSKYPNVMQIVREETGRNMNEGAEIKSRVMAKKKGAIELFEAFYEEVRGEELSEERKRIMTDMIKELEEGRE